MFPIIKIQHGVRKRYICEHKDKRHELSTPPKITSLTFGAAQMVMVIFFKYSCDETILKFVSYSFPSHFSKLLINSL